MAIPSKYFLARLSGIPWILNWLNRNRLLVLTYHGVYEGPKKQGSLPETFVHVNDMAEQLRYLKNRYCTIDADGLLASFKNGSGLPTNAMLVTFDDGYESFYRLAIPVLNSINIRPLVFIPTYYVESSEPFWFDFVWLFIKLADQQKLLELIHLLNLELTTVDRNRVLSQCLRAMKYMIPEQRQAVLTHIKEMKPPPSHGDKQILKLFCSMSAEQIKELSEKGVTFGGHTHTHTILSTMPEEVANSEITRNKLELEDLIQRPVYFFGYPNGDQGDFEERHKGLLIEAGYKAAFSLTQRRSVPNLDSMDISRINVVPEDIPESLYFRCTGITPLLEQFRHPGLFRKSIKVSPNQPSLLLGP
jgi:peptidoglycan/xylan/chitin deacetylase (PgdA/CDA1 family)